MPIKIRYPDLDFGQVWYIKNDHDQFPHLLTGVLKLPGDQVMFRLSYLGEITFVYDFECSMERNLEIMEQNMPPDDLEE